MIDWFHQDLSPSSSVPVALETESFFAIAVKGNSLTFYTRFP
ncbi:hypothetical protein LEP1GSC196_0367 [Leptospira meyeri serovar Semaranga str. Veldrot Semarang 173]|nr:hypothetical protein LEP1GSC196_0367 [Leptospira meyeri serovar Semaranga str. Veldrot Semarang 173]